jgi:hypothetical protein
MFFSSKATRAAIIFYAWIHATSSLAFLKEYSTIPSWDIRRGCELVTPW